MGVSADGADVGPVVVGAAAGGLVALALRGAVSRRVLGGEDLAAVEAVQAVDMG